MSADEIRKAQNVDEMISIFVRNIPEIEKTGKVQYDYLWKLFSNGAHYFPNLPIECISGYEAMVQEIFSYIAGRLINEHHEDVRLLTETFKENDNRNAIIMGFDMAIRAMVNVLNDYPAEGNPANEDKEPTGEFDDICGSPTDDKFINMMCVRMREEDPKWDINDDRKLKKAYASILGPIIYNTKYNNL